MRVEVVQRVSQADKIIASFIPDVGDAGPIFIRIQLPWGMEIVGTEVSSSCPKCEWIYSCFYTMVGRSRGALSTALCNLVRHGTPFITSKGKQDEITNVLWIRCVPEKTNKDNGEVYTQPILSQFISTETVK